MESEDSRTIRVGILGCGVIAPTHLAAYEAVPGVRVAAIADPDAAAREKLGQRYAGRPWKAFGDYRELVKSGLVDAVSVCSDHASHEELVCAAAEAGLAVLCEKPLGISLASLERMETTAREQGVVAAGVFQHRFDAVYRQTRAVVHEGWLGQLLNAHVFHSSQRTADYYRGSSWRGRRAAEGGSLLINQSIHFVDILQWICGGVETVMAHTANQIHTDIIETEDTAALSLAFGNGALGGLTASTGSHETWRVAVDLAGSDGRLRIVDGRLEDCRHRDGKVEDSLRERLLVGEAEGEVVGRAYYGSGHSGQIRDFVEAIREGRAPAIPLSEARPAVEVVLAAYASARSGRRMRPGENSIALEHGGS